jgi:hypothetical protein
MDLSVVKSFIVKLKECGYKISDSAMPMWMVQCRRLSHDQLSAFSNYLVDNVGLSTSLMRDRLQSAAFGGNGAAPMLPAFLSLLVGGLDYEAAAPIEKISDPVHGPFDNALYNDPEFVERYVDTRYETRVADMISLLARIPSGMHIVAPGDGAGVVCEAVRELNSRGHTLVSYSSDPSPIMSKIARLRGNIVHVEDAVTTRERFPDSLFVLSHVTDYLSPREIYNFSLGKCIVLGRATEFPNCGHFKPYRAAWGYQLCTSNYNLYGYNPTSIMREVRDLDYTVFAKSQDLPVVAVSQDLPLYRDHAVRMGIVVDDLNPSRVITAHFKTLSNIEVGVPSVGVINKYSVYPLFCVTPLEGAHFAYSHDLPYLDHPAFIGKKFFCKAEAVYYDNGVSLHKILPQYVDGMPFYAHSFRSGVIRIDSCECFGQIPHSHSLSVVPQRFVEWNMIKLACRRSVQGRVTKSSLYTVLVNSIGKEDQIRFEHFCRVADCVYTTEGEFVSDCNG